MAAILIIGPVLSMASSHCMNGTPSNPALVWSAGSTLDVLARLVIGEGSGLVEADLWFCGDDGEPVADSCGDR
jgi:hypothetical protein